MGCLRCQLCQIFCSLNIALLLSHLLKVHSSDPQFYITCDASGCQCTFTNTNTYKSLLNRAHKDLGLQASVVIDENENGVGESEQMETDSGDRNVNNDSEDGDYFLEDRKKSTRDLIPYSS